MRDKGRKTRQKIVRAALDIFSVKGFYKASINDILEASGVTKGCFFGHFPDKESLWAAAYDEAAAIWRGIVFKDLRKIEDPLERMERFIERDMRDYLGADVFPGGCFFLNTLVDLSGRSEKLAGRVWQSYRRTSEVLCLWLDEAQRKGILSPDRDHKEIGNFIIVSLNGAAALYSPTKDPAIWKDTISQLRSYIRHLRK